MPTHNLIGEMPVAEYTHPGRPETVMRAYRQFLIALKARWMGHGRGHRALRAHMHYRPYVDEYLAAKRLCFANDAEGQS